MEHDKIIYHFVVVDEKFQVLMRGCVFEDRKVTLSFRHSAPETEVTESYSSFDCILQMIPSGTLPTIQFGTKEKMADFV